MADESTSLRDDEMKEVSGGTTIEEAFAEDPDMPGWKIYKGSKGSTLLCPKCMSSRLLYFDLLGWVQFSCRDCKHRFEESEAGCRTSGNF